MTDTNDSTLYDTLSLATTPAAKVDALFELMRLRGQSFYDESVTQLAHALQAACLARNHGASAEQITAALLHDIGHFLLDEHAEQSEFLAEDWHHEAVGAESLDPFFSAPVTEPIRLHVPAKRYLCTIDSAYFDGLSQASKRSFELQGGAMTDIEVTEFEDNVFYKTAVLLRRWDDGAKVKGLTVPDLEAYRSEVESCLAVQ